MMFVAHEDDDIDKLGKSGFFAFLKALFKLIFGARQSGKEIYDNTSILMRQKYVISRVAEHVGIDKFEPAPLLNLSVLDAGCGTRSVGEGLTLRGADVTAIDIDEESLEKAKKSAEKFGTPIVFMNKSPEKLIMENTQYDVVLCLNLFQYSDNVDKLVWTLSQLLKQDGVLVFSAFKRNFVSSLWHKWMVEWVLGWRPKGHHNLSRFFNEKMLTNLLEKHGFEVVQMTGATFDIVDMRWRKMPTGHLRFVGSAKIRS